MYTLITSMPVQNLLTEQLPVLALSWVIAETFYKFHSFTLETAAFLATWFVLDGIYKFILGMLKGRSKNS